MQKRFPQFFRESRHGILLYLNTNLFNVSAYVCALAGEFEEAEGKQQACLLSVKNRD